MDPGEPSNVNPPRHTTDPYREKYLLTLGMLARLMMRLFETFLPNSRWRRYQRLFYSPHYKGAHKDMCTARDKIQQRRELKLPTRHVSKQ
jgi:hypothetical protein